MATKFDPIYKFLLQNHAEENITLFKSSASNWDWAREINRSSIATKDGLIIFILQINF